MSTPAASSTATRTEYDQVGNAVKAISPRGVETTDDPDDFAQVAVFDTMNRPKETRAEFDKDDSRYNTPDSTFYTYDAIERPQLLSAPPSAVQSVRDDTAYT